MANASALIIHRNKILLFHRDNISIIPHPDCWHLPGGGIEEEETSEQAVRRELSEEVTHVPDDLQLIFVYENQSFLYLGQVDDSEVSKFILGTGEGQEIKFFTLKEALSLKLTPTLRLWFQDYGDIIQRWMY